MLIVIVQYESMMNVDAAEPNDLTNDREGNSEMATPTSYKAEPLPRNDSIQRAAFNRCAKRIRRCPLLLLNDLAVFEPQAPNCRGLLASPTGFELKPANISWHK